MESNAPENYPAPMRLLVNAEELSMPFSDAVKYGILAVSIALLLLALAILAWQISRCWSQTHTTLPQESRSHELFYSVRRSRTAGNYSGAPSIKHVPQVEDVAAKAHRLSSCLSQGSFPSSASSQPDGELLEQPSIRQVNGSLRFSVYYDRLQSLLVVTVLQVEGLLDQGQTCNLQPFVKLRLMLPGSKAVEVEECSDVEGEGSAPVMWTVLQEWRTHTVKGSCNPLFGDQFSRIVQEEKELQQINLRMEVRHFDKLSRDTVLGEVRVPLGQHNISYPLELQQDLKMPQKDLVGEVLLSLKYLPTSQRLEVGLLKVRTVLTEICSDAALYARISVQCNQCRLRYQKTSAVGRCLLTVFNEVLMFTLPEPPVEQCRILVSVYETRTTRKTSKHLLGHFTVGTETGLEDKHWGLMMSSVRQPVAKWHSLLI